MLPGNKTAHDPILIQTFVLFNFSCSNYKNTIYMRKAVRSVLVSTRSLAASKPAAASQVTEQTSVKWPIQLPKFGKLITQHFHTTMVQ